MKCTVVKPFCFWLIYRLPPICAINAHLVKRILHGMSQVCQVTGKKPMSGNNVSHANNATKRRYLPNLHYHRFWVPSENRYVKLRVSSAGIRLIDKKGIEVILAEIRERGVKV